MSDISGRHAASLKKLLLKGEDTEKTLDRLAHAVDPAFAPRPSLGSNQINHRHAAQLQLLCEPQVEIGRVGQDRELRLFLWNRIDQLAELAPDARDVDQHLHQSQYGDGAHIDDGAYSSGLHPR